MRGFTAVRGAGERKFLVAQSVTIGRAPLQERQRLQRLDRRTRKYRRRYVADRKHRGSIGIGDGDGGAMGALQERPAYDFDKNRVSHAKFASLGWI